MWMNMARCRGWAFKHSAKNDKLFIPGVLPPEHWNQYSTLLLEVLHLFQGKHSDVLNRKKREDPVLSGRSSQTLSLFVQYSVFIILFKILTLSILMLVSTASLNYQETELATYNVVYLAYILTVIKLVLGINMVALRATLSSLSPLKWFMIISCSNLGSVYSDWGKCRFWLCQMIALWTDLTFMIVSLSVNKREWVILNHQTARVFLCFIFTVFV